MSDTVRFEMRLKKRLAERIDEQRGLASRAAWIQQAIEGALTSPSAKVGKPTPKGVEKAEKVVAGLDLKKDPNAVRKTKEYTLPKIAPRRP